MQLNTSEIKIIKEHWKTVMLQSPEFSNSFYDHLFEMSPELKSLFQKRVSEQGKKLIQVLNTIVVSLESFDVLLEDLKELGYRHTNYYGYQKNIIQL